MGHELCLCLPKETGRSEEAMEQPVTWGWWMQVLMGRVTRVSIAFRFALRDQWWELPRSILRLNPFSTVRGARQELQTEKSLISHWTPWLRESDLLFRSHPWPSCLVSAI